MTLTTRAALFLALVATGCMDTQDTPVPTSSDTTTDELPIAASTMSLTTAENVPVAFDVADADDVAGMTFTASRPHHGQVSGSGPTFTYTPIINWNGSDTIDVTVSDGQQSVDIPVTIKVTPVDQAPVAVDDSLSTSENAPLVIPIESLLENDGDVDSLVLSITAVTNATNGTAELDGMNVTFTPDPDFAGTAGFDYTLSDGQLTSTAHVTIDVLVD